MNENVSLQAYLESQIAAEHRLIEQRFALVEKAVQKAEEAMQLRLEGMNEWRASLSDLSDTFIRRDALAPELAGLKEQMDRLSERVRALERGASELQGRMWAINALWALAVLGVSIALRFIG